MQQQSQSILSVGVIEVLVGSSGSAVNELYYCEAECSRWFSVNQLSFVFLCMGLLLPISSVLPLAVRRSC